MKLVLASGNPKKMQEMRRILEPMGFEVLSPADLNAVSDAEETGETFAENARIKALDLLCKTGIPAIADDSGLCVDALSGRPGVYSARYGGEELAYPEKIAMLLGELAGVPEQKRGAHFACAICCALAPDELIEAEGKCGGNIGFAPKGGGGFGYDPVFMVGEESFASLAAAEKDRISHRSAALRVFAEKMKTYLANKGVNE